MELGPWGLRGRQNLRVAKAGASFHAGLLSKIRTWRVRILGPCDLHNLWRAQPGLIRAHHGKVLCLGVQFLFQVLEQL